MPLNDAIESIPTDLRATLSRTWCVVDTGALRANLRTLRGLTGSGTLMAPVVKSNAYGHGMFLAARAFVDAGADWLCVDALVEAIALRQAGFKLPILVLGHTPPEHAPHAVTADVRLIAYDAALLDALSEAAQAAGTRARVHLKVETGTHRQGLPLRAAVNLVRHATALPAVEIEGASSHFANVEDTTDHTFAHAQMAAFDEIVGELRKAGAAITLRSIANSAATLLWRDAHLELARPGIACYGMWPSKETLVSAMMAGRRVELRPALSWHTRIAQVKEVPVGGMVGYGCTFRATHKARIAVLPVGYYDGYDRKLSNLAHVLIHSQRAQVRGRVCMNMMMVDVTDIPEARRGDDVVLLGQSGSERVSAEMLAEWSGTINYEVTTRIHEGIPRIPAAPLP